jgi:hypothetical protein
MASSHFSVYKYFHMSENKSLLNWTLCQPLHLKTQLNENIYSERSVILTWECIYNTLVYSYLTSGLIKLEYYVAVDEKACQGQTL